MKDEPGNLISEQPRRMFARPSFYKEEGVEGSTIHILLIEDSAAGGRQIQALLTEVGVNKFALTPVRSLKDALEQLGQRGFDLVLVDLSLSDAISHDVATRLRRLHPTLPVVVLNSAVAEDLSLNIVRREAQDYLLNRRGSGAMLGRVIRDAIEHRSMQQQVVHFTHYDPVTQLPNRTLFRDRFSQALQRARQTDKTLALLCLDLDRFKPINDSLGHESGDRLLKNVAERLLGCLRSNDTIARIGGDEFLIVLDHISTAEHAALTAEKILRALSAPIRIGDIDVTVSTSIGIATFPRDGTDAETLLKNADAAMYRVKEIGRNNYQFYEPEMNARAYERLTLESALHRALANHEFVLQYQPIRSLHDDRVTGLEALMRWQHPTRGLLMPADFIPLMEESSLVVSAGEWALRTACRHYHGWRARGLPPLRLKLNFSARQFGQNDLAVKIARVLEEERVSPSSLVIEITEGMLMENTESSRKLLHTLRDMRLQISLDDFGTGYSSLGYLKSFPINSLKIDGSFVRDLPTDPDNAAIVCAIIDLAHHLRLRVIAEGVETPAQVEFLRQHGCDEAQGFFFSHPLSAENVLAYCLGESALAFGS